MPLSDHVWDFGYSDIDHVGEDGKLLSHEETPKNVFLKFEPSWSLGRKVHFFHSFGN